MIPLRVWLGLAAILALAGVLWHDHWMTQRYNAKAAQVRAVTASYEAKLKTEHLQAKANIASQVHHDEDRQIDDFTAANPVHGGLCDKPAGVRTAAAPDARDAGAGPAAAGVQPVPAGHPDRGSSVDSRGLLGSLAERADRLSAQVREWQGR